MGPTPSRSSSSLSRSPYPVSICRTERPSRSAGQWRSDPTTTPDGTPNTISTVHSAPSPVLATPNLGHSFHAKVRLNLAAFHMDKAVQLAGKILDLREDHTEDHWQTKWILLLNLPETIHGPFDEPTGCGFGISREVDLGRIRVQGCPRLHHLSLHQTIADVLTDSATSASSQRRTPAQREADRNQRGIRKPDIVWWASALLYSTRFTILAGVSEIKCDVEKAKAGFVQGILYTAQVHSLTGAQLGSSIFKVRFARFFALSENVVAVDALNFVAGTASAASAMNANSLFDILESLTNTAFVDSLPLSLRAPDGAVDKSGLAAIAKWSRCAYRQLLRLPSQGPLRRLPRSRSVAADRLLSSLTTELHKFEERSAAVEIVRGKKKKAVSASPRSSDAHVATGSLSGSPANTKRVRAEGRPRSNKRRTPASTSAGDATTQTGGSSGKPAPDDAEIALSIIELHVAHEDAGHEADDETGQETEIEDDDIGWEDGGKEDNEPATSPLSLGIDTVPMPKASRDSPDNVPEASSDESLSEGRVMEVLRLSDIRIIFLPPHELDALIEEEQEEEQDGVAKVAREESSSIVLGGLLRSELC